MEKSVSLVKVENDLSDVKSVERLILIIVLKRCNAVYVGISYDKVNIIFSLF
jgi:hypothetical protein